MSTSNFTASKCSVSTLLFLYAFTSLAKAQPYVYVANIAGYTVSVVNPTNNSIVGSIAVPGPSGLAVTPDGSYVYVAAQTANSVYVLSTASNSVLTTIPVGTTPVQVAITPNGQYAFIVNQDSNDVSVIDTASKSVVAKIPVGLRPNTVAISPDSTRAYVTNLWGGDISVIDTGSKSVINTFDASSGPSGIAVAPNGRVYVANEYGGVVTAHDPSGNLLATISGFAFPTAVAVSGSHVYVTNANASSVTVIDATSNSVIATIPVGAFPTSIAVSPDRTRAYVTNEYSFSLSILNTATNTVASTVSSVGIYPYAVAMVPPAGPPPVCTYSLSPASASLGSGGGSGTVNVSSNCAWTASSNASWISINSGQSGNGNGVVTFTALPNPGTAALSGTLTIGGKTFTVSEAGIACSYSLSANGASMGSGGGSGAVNIVAPAGCVWSVSSDSAWLTVNLGSPGSGSGTVNFSASPNGSTAARTGNLNIAGQKFGVSEAGVSFSGIRVNCGGPAMSDSNGNLWSADNQGNHSESTAAIANTSFPALYQKESWSTGALQYQFSVPDGLFTVKLHFSEIYLTQRGQRMFNILINGQTVHAGFDILSYTGLNTAYDESYPVTASNGQITVQLVPVTGTPKIAGIEVF